jgi:hypothetical protein
MSSANRQSLAGRVCFCLLAVAIALFLLASVREIERDLTTNSDWDTYFTKDAMHYYVIAQAFASSDYSMSYEKRWPYRQPLFPLLVAGIMKATNNNLFAIRLLNVGLIIATTMVLFLVLRSFGHDSPAAAIISLLFVLNPFVYDQSVRGLNTEPLHLFLLICIIASFLRYVAVRHWIYLSLLALTLGLDYLDRINGLFLAFSAIAVLICFAFGQYFFGPEHRSILATRQHADLSSEALAKEEALSKGEARAKGEALAKGEASGVSGDGAKSDTPGRRHADLSAEALAKEEVFRVSDQRAKADTQYNASWWHYLLAALVLIGTTAPSWLSRLYHFGHPFYHGAIQNFLWGDSYLGSMDSPRMLTASDYFASHSLLDAAGRFLLGSSKVFFAIPIDRERLPILYFAALAGIWLIWRRKLTPYLWLLLFYLLQMLPLAWTQPVNTTPRIPYAATQPFELFFAAIFVQWAWAKSQSQINLKQNPISSPASKR